MNTRLPVTALLMATLIFLTSSSGQTVQWTMEAGVSKAVDETARSWDEGFTAATNAFLILDEHVLFGGRLAYHRWSPNDRAVRDELSLPAEALIAGAITIVEVVPTIRITTAREFDVANFFIQGGAGLYVFRSDLVANTGTPQEGTEVAIEKISERRLGFSAGGGITLGDISFMTVELLPLYHVLFSEREAHQFFTAGLGISFRI